MLHPHQNFNQKFNPYHIFAPKFCGFTRPTRPLPKFDSHNPWTHAPTLPTLPTLFRRLLKLMWTAVPNIQLQRNFTTDNTLENIRDFENLFWIMASKFISTDEKHFQCWQYSEKYCHNWCHFDVFIIISRHTAWLEDSEAVVPRASMENLVKSTRKHLCRGFFLNKITGWKPINSSNRDCGTGVFLWVLRNSQP